MTDPELVCEDVDGYSLRVVRVFRGRLPVATISVDHDGALIVRREVPPGTLEAVQAHLRANP